MKEGLHSNNVISMLEDSRGIVWMATDYGLYAYDGVEITHFSSKQHGLAYDFIDNISEDINGNIWISCVLYKGYAYPIINVLNPITKEVFTLDEYLENVSPTQAKTIKRSFSHRQHQVIESKDGKIYSCDGKHLHKEIDFNNRIDYAVPIPLGKTHFVQFTGEDGNSFDFYDIEKNEITERYHVQDSTRTIIYYLIPDDSGVLYWIELGKDRYAPDQILHFYKKNIHQDVIHLNTVALKNDKRIEYALTQNYNYYLFSVDSQLHYYSLTGELLDHFEHSNIVEINRHNHKLVDSKGGIWGKRKRTGGITCFYFNRSPFKSYQIFDEWVGMRGMHHNEHGLFTNTVRRYSFNGLVTKDSVNLIPLRGGASVFESKTGQLWVSTPNRYIIIYDEKGNRLKEHHFEKKGDYWMGWALHQDQEGRLWGGSIKGMFYLDSTSNYLKSFEDYNGYDELKSNTTYHFHEKGNDLWIASSSGLYRWDKTLGIQERFHTKGGEKNYLPCNIIVHIYEDKDGIFWLSTKGGGLIKFDPQSNATEQYTVEEGLAHNVIYAAYEDDYNNLWMSSNYGIMRFNKNTKAVNSYTQENGLLDNEFNTTAHTMDSTGRIYFGSQLGVITFHPKDFQENKMDKKYSLKITELSKISKETDEYTSVLAEYLKTNSIALYPEDKGFNLKIALLDYRNPQLHQYAYKIEGYDKKWHYQNSASIRLQNLPYAPKGYLMHIKVKGIDGNWQHLEQPIHIAILRPWHEQPIFRLSLLLLALILLFMGAQYRTKRLKKRQKELEDLIKIRTQKIAQQAEDLKALDKLKSRFFTNITHELRTPLTLILGPILSILSNYKKAKELPIKKTVERLQTVHKNGEQLLGLIEEILDLSKLQAHKLDLNEESIQLSSFVQRIFGTFKSQAEYLKIDYQLNYKFDDNLHVLLDENKVTKILNNLLSNALKFTPGGQLVELEVKELNTTLEFLVRDSGVGIHPNDLPHVFERYYQAKYSGTTAQGGTGLGLTLVYEFAKFFKGSIHVESELGKGTLFHLSLPKKVAEASSSIASNEALELPLILDETPAKQGLSNKNQTILLVEDQLEMRQFIASLLEEEYQLLFATNGKEGLSLLEEHQGKVDLIVSDVMMPQMDGFEMLKRIKAQANLRTIPMIMLTARAAIADKLNALTIGVDDYLTKPFSIEELKVRIANLLQNAAERKSWQKEEQSDENLSIEEAPELPQVSEEDLLWVKELEEHIKTQLDEEELSIEELAKKMFMSERHLRRKLKKITGLSTIKLIKTIRMNMARDFLEKGVYSSVIDVAYAVGFSSAGTFSRAYKQYFGKAPKVYLKKVKS